MSSKSALVEAGIKTVAIFRIQMEMVSLISSNTAVKPNTASLWADTTDKCNATNGIQTLKNVIAGHVWPVTSGLSLLSSRS